MWWFSKFKGIFYQIKYFDIEFLFLWIIMNIMDLKKEEEEIKSICDLTIYNKNAIHLLFFSVKLIFVKCNCTSCELQSWLIKYYKKFR
jgi:hypothetical protein